MADNNLARTRSNAPDFFADGDPLAELARLVGFEEPQVARVAANEPVKEARREPSFNLEDELLREFERYDSPRLDPSQDVPLDEVADHAVAALSRQQFLSDFHDDAPVLAPAPVEPAAPVAHEPAASPEAVEHEPAQDVGEDHFIEPAFLEPQFEEIRLAEPQVADQPAGAVSQDADLFGFDEESLHADLLAASSVEIDAVAQENGAVAGHVAAETFGAPSIEPENRSQNHSEYGEHASHVETARSDPFFDVPDFAHASESVRAPEVFEAPEVAAMPAATMAVSVPSQGFDLADELETSIGVGSAPTPVQPVAGLAETLAAATAAAAAASQRKPGFTPSFRMPLANFNLGGGTSSLQRQPAAQAPVSDLPKPVAEAGWDNPVGWNPATAAAEGPVSAIPVPVPPVSMAPAAEKAANTPERFNALDEMVYDVTRIAPNAAPVEAHRIADVSVSDAKAVPAAAPQAIAPPQPPVVHDLVTEPDPFIDEEFELALEDLELDLADLVFAENDRQMLPATSAAADPAAPVTKAAPLRVEPAIEVPGETRPVAVAAPVRAPAAVIAPAVAAPAPPVAPPVLSKPAPVPAAPVAAAALAASAAAADLPEVEDELPFDAAQISDSEDHVEAIADLNVPELPAELPDEAPVYPPEYDLDIDAELATLLVNHDEPARGRQSRVEASTAALAASAAKPASSAPRSIDADLDDFERALEEDFRRSLATPLPSAAEDYDMAENGAMEGEHEGRRSRSWILPLAVVGVLVVGGAGAYAMFGKGVGSIVGNGEPVIIAADKDPIKVVPENPGGKTVPNQDKAVYDRVSGTPEQPKQQSLISSDEQPVDVVQKTLMPDQMPQDSDGDGDVADNGDTQDPRLLPQQGEQLASDQDAVTVAPRRVKTMIVRPDGKLVEQDAPAASAAMSVATAQSEKMPAASAKTPDIASAQPAGNAPVANGMAPASAPADQTAQLINASAPSDGNAAPMIAHAPVPAARPSSAPPKMVASAADTAATRAPSAPAAPAQTQAPATASAEGGYVIQIASLPSQADAQKSYKNLSTKFGSVIGGRGVDIKAADVGGKGTYYRVRIPAGSKADAVALCEKYRSAGGTCLVAR